jgi:hypothetical protein
LNQFYRIAQGQRDDVGVGMTEKLVRHLILFRPRRRMEAERDAELFNFGP